MSPNSLTKSLEGEIKEQVSQKLQIINPECI